MRPGRCRVNLNQLCVDLDAAPGKSGREAGVDHNAANPRSLRGVTSGAQLLWMELGAVPTSIKDAADRAGLFPCAASRHILALLDAGLVEKVGTGWVRC